jgi:hypothetical protein
MKLEVMMVLVALFVGLRFLCSLVEGIMSGTNTLDDFSLFLWNVRPRQYHGYMILMSLELGLVSFLE